MKRFDDYINERLELASIEPALLVARNRLCEAIRTSLMSSHEGVLFEAMIEDYGTSVLFEENLTQKAKAAFDKIKSKSKDALNGAEKKLIEIGGNMRKLITEIVAKVKDAMRKVWDETKKIAAKAVSGAKEELTKKVEKVDKNALVDEVKNFKTMSSVGINWALTGFPSKVDSAGQKALTLTESYEMMLEIAVTESLVEYVEEGLEIFESDDHSHNKATIPYASDISGKIAKIPPFNALHKIQHVASDIAKVSLDKLSEILAEHAGAPGPFEFAILSHLIGAIVETVAKEAIAGGVLAAVGFIPGINVAVMILKKIALTLTVIGILEEVLKTVDKKSNEHS